MSWNRKKRTKSPFVLTKEFIKCDGLVFSQNQLMNSRKSSGLFVCGLFFSGEFKANKKITARLTLITLSKFKEVFIYHYTILLGLNKETYI